MATRFNISPKQFDPRRPPVLLLGGINLVRTLGLAGIPAIVASSDPHEPAFASRYCVGRCAIPPFDSGEAVVDALVSLGDRLTVALGRRVPVMYGSDGALEVLHAHRERLQRYFLFLVSDRDIGRALNAKDAFARLAEDRALPVPRELSWDELERADHEVLVKPRVKIDWYGSTLRERLFNGEGKARVFASGAQLRANPVACHYRDQLIFQEFIPGDDTCLWSYHGFADENGQVLASFVGRKIRTYPVGNGESAFIEMSEEPALEAVGRDVAAKLPLKGVFKMDFKRDPRDGRWLLLEVNARFNLWNYLGAANGVNLMQAAYDYLVDGTAPAPLPVRNMYRWLSFQLDFKAFRELSSRGELGLGSWLYSLLDSRNLYNVFSWRDPLPWVMFWTSRFTRRGGRAAGRVAGLVRQWRSTAS
jgi:D-aspartate ligase